MLDGPRQDWAFYEERVRPIDRAWLQSLTTADRWAIYCDMFNLIWNARKQISGDWQRLDEQRWREKLALRLKMVDAFQKRDQLLRERAAKKDSS
ncbi:MAG TPA: hypothetical protein VKB78_06365 [Pirellulales bacterium]|nr:hypothetical protein [Pirellulales bacterium]